MLRLNSKPIWNIVDLKREFSPAEIYGRKKDFLLFAKVHCMVFPTRLSERGDDSYEACYLTKSFWYGILAFNYDGSISPEGSWLDYFLEERIKEELGESYGKSDEADAREEAGYEVRDACLKEKLDYICANAKIGDSEEEKLKALVLLAICEITEIDARNQKFDDCVPEEKGAQPIKEFKDIELNEESHILNLEASKTHYRFGVFENDSLPSGMHIRTLRIEAEASKNKYDNVILDFCNKNGEIIRSVILRPGEYRYLNVAGGEVIGFLPSVSIENGCCVYRNGYGSGSIKIATSDNKPRTISKTEYECFASAGKNAGVLFASGGKIVTDYCEVPLDYRTKLVFDMVIAGLNVVEIAYVSGDVKVLSDSGKVYSILYSDGDLCGWHNISLKLPDEENVVSLSNEMRIGKEPVTAEDVLETAVSFNGTETAALLRSGECRINYR